jgi:hypothetical protein
LSSIKTKEVQITGMSCIRTRNADSPRFYAWRSTIWQFLRYWLVGGVNTLIDLAILLEVLYSNGLVWLAGKALQPVIANTILWGEVLYKFERPELVLSC